jgi:hypothetical protein
MLIVLIFALAQCTPNDSYCSLVTGPGGLHTFPTVAACRAEAEAQTRRYEAAGSHGYHGKCVSNDAPAWKEE